jgi:hypothetical protein
VHRAAALLGITALAVSFWLGQANTTIIQRQVTTQEGQAAPAEPQTQKAAAPPPVNVDDTSEEDQLGVISVDSLPKLGAGEQPQAGEVVGARGPNRRLVPAEPSGEPTAAAASAPGAFPEARATALVTGAAEMAKLCRMPGSVTGPGKVRVTFESSGLVSNVVVLPPYAGTPAGACVAQKFKSVKIPSFTGAPVTLSKKFFLAAPN